MCSPHCYISVVWRWHPIVETCSHYNWITSTTKCCVRRYQHNIYYLIDTQQYVKYKMRLVLKRSTQLGSEHNWISDWQVTRPANTVTWFLKPYLRTGTERHFSRPPGRGSCVGWTRAPAVPRRFLWCPFRSRGSAVPTFGVAPVRPSVPATSSTELLRPARGLRNTNNHRASDYHRASDHHRAAHHNRGEAMRLPAKTLVIFWDSGILFHPW
jgi:hypothetical protein